MAGDQENGLIFPPEYKDGTYLVTFKLKCSLANNMPIISKKHMMV